MREETKLELLRVCGVINQIAGAVKAETDMVVGSRDHIEIIRHYNWLRTAVQSINNAREELGHLADHLSHEDIPEIMREHDIRTMTIEDVGRVTVSYKYSCSMLDKPVAMDWLRSNGHGGLIIETVNSSTLAAFAKSMLLDDGIELPNEIFKTGTYPYTSITKISEKQNGQ
jgi:hypothetical protein